jgi:hypothetical protein
MEDYSKKRNKPSTQRGYQGVIDRCIIPMLGRKKVQDVKRPDIAGLMEKLAYKPAEANKASACCARCSTWPKCGATARTAPTRAATSRCTRRQGNPAHRGRRTGAIFRHWRSWRPRAGELRHPAGDPPAIRVRRPPLRNLPARMGLGGLENRRVVWPDSKTGGMSKPMSEEAYRLLSTAPRRKAAPTSCRRPTTRPST